MPELPEPRYWEVEVGCSQKVYRITSFKQLSEAEISVALSNPKLITGAEPTTRYGLPYTFVDVFVPVSGQSLD